LKKASNINFFFNPSSGGRVVPCRQADVHMKLKVVFFIFCALA